MQPIRIVDSFRPIVFVSLPSIRFTLMAIDMNTSFTHFKSSKASAEILDRFVCAVFSIHREVRGHSFILVSFEVDHVSEISLLQLLYSFSDARFF